MSACAVPLPLRPVPELSASGPRSHLGLDSGDGQYWPQHRVGREGPGLGWAGLRVGDGVPRWAAVRVRAGRPSPSQRQGQGPGGVGELRSREQSCSDGPGQAEAAHGHRLTTQPRHREQRSASREDGSQTSSPEQTVTFPLAWLYVLFLQRTNKTGRRAQQVRSEHVVGPRGAPGSQLRASAPRGIPEEARGHCVGSWELG